MTKKLQKIKDLLHKYNDIDQSVIDEIEKILNDTPKSDDVLTIVANKGSHAINETLLPGCVFYASEGNLGGSPMNPETLITDLEKIAKQTTKILKNNFYKKIYIVPSGLPIISLTISAIVSQVTAKPIIPLQYDRESGQYWKIDLPIRELVTQVT